MAAGFPAGRALVCRSERKCDAVHGQFTSCSRVLIAKIEKTHDAYGELCNSVTFDQVNMASYLQVQRP